MIAGRLASASIAIVRPAAAAPPPRPPPPPPPRGRVPLQARCRRSRCSSRRARAAWRATDRATRCPAVRVRACSRMTCSRQGRTADAAAHWALCRRRRGRGPDQLRELHRETDSIRRSQTADGDPRVLRVEQRFRNLTRLAGIHTRNLRRVIRRHLHRSGFFLLQLHVDHDHRRTTRRRDRFVIGALNRDERLLQRLRRGVPLRVAAHHAGHIVGAVRGNETQVPSRDQQGGGRSTPDRSTSRRAGCRSSRAAARRLARRLAVAMRHRHRGFLVKRSNELRLDVGRVAVIDDRFLNALEARPDSRRRARCRDLAAPAPSDRNRSPAARVFPPGERRLRRVRAGRRSVAAGVFDRGARWWRRCVCAPDSGT